MSLNSKFNYQYQVGGCLSESSQMYIERQADFDLYQGLKAGKLCFVLNARQMGKSSLRVKLMKTLKQEGFSCAAIEMREICSYQVTQDQFYASFISNLIINLDLDIDEDEWWKNHNYISPVQKAHKFIQEELLNKTSQGIFLFIDEIDTILNLEYKDDFFVFIRSCYNNRADQEQYNKINFVILGVATASDLIEDKFQTPFNIDSLEIELTGFTYEQAKILEKGLPENITNATEVLKEILRWTGGQPFLTQWFCHLVSKEPSLPTLRNEAEWVKQIAQIQIIKNWLRHDKQQHLRTIRDRIINNEKYVCHVLGLYQQILEAKEILADGSVEQTQLRLSGLVIKQNGKLLVCNYIYAEIFDKTWISKSLTNLRPYAEAMNLWLDSNRQDKSQLLQGKDLKQAKDWAKDKSLTEDDHRFLSDCDELEKLVLEQENALLTKANKFNDMQFWLLFALLPILAGLFFSNQTFQEKQEAAVIDKELDKYSDNSIEKLKSAMLAGQRLHNLVKNGRPLQEYPTVKPILALQRILADIDTTQHPYSVYDVAFSPNGKTIVTAHADGTAKLWNLSTKNVVPLKGHQDSVWKVSFNPNGQRIATLGRDNTMRIWDLSGRQLSTIRWEPQSFFIHNLILTPDWQNLIAVDYYDVNLLNFKTKSLSQWKTEYSIYYSSLSPNGQIIATIGEGDNIIRLWNLSGKKLSEWKVKGYELPKLRFITDEILMTLGDENNMIFWNVNGDLLSEVELKVSDIQSFSVNFNSQVIVTRGKENTDTVNIWNFSGKLLNVIKGKPGDFKTFSFSPDGKRLVTGGNNGAVSVFDLSEKRISQIIQGKHKKHDKAQWSLPKIENNDVFISSTGKYTATLEKQDKAVNIWSSQTEYISKLNLANSKFKQIYFSPSDKYVATVAIQNPKILTVEDTNYTIQAPKLRHTVYMWDISGKILGRLNGYLGNIERVDFSPNGQLLLTKEEDSTIRVWDISGKQLAVFKLATTVGDVSFSTDSRHLITVLQEGKIKILELSGKLVSEVTIGQTKLNYARFSPNAQIILTAEKDGMLRIWDNSGRKLTELSSYSFEFKGVRFSQDSQSIAILESNEARIWELSGHPIRQIGIFSNFKDFTPDGQHVITQEYSNVQIQRIKTLDELLKEGCEWLKEDFINNLQVLTELHVCRKKSLLLEK